MWPMARHFFIVLLPCALSEDTSADANMCFLILFFISISIVQA